MAISDHERNSRVNPLLKVAGKGLKSAKETASKTVSYTFNTKCFHIWIFVNKNKWQTNIVNSKSTTISSVIIYFFSGRSSCREDGYLHWRGKKIHGRSLEGGRKTYRGGHAALENKVTANTHTFTIKSKFLRCLYSTKSRNPVLNFGNLKV